jgi:hypothetical protein
MRVIDGWEYKKLQKKDSRIVTLGENRRFEKFMLGTIDCFSWLVDPYSIWAFYGETSDFGELFNYLDDCVEYTGYDFIIPTPEDLSFMIGSDGFVSYLQKKLKFTINDVWHSEHVDDGVRRSIFFLRGEK